MDYEKGKAIENVVYELKEILGYYGDKRTDLEGIYTVIDRQISVLDRILGRD